MNAVQEIIRTTDCETALGTVRVASSERGLVYLGFPLATGRGFTGWRERFAPGCVSRKDQDANHRENTNQKESHSEGRPLTIG